MHLDMPHPHLDKDSLLSLLRGCQSPSLTALTTPAPALEQHPKVSNVLMLKGWERCFGLWICYLDWAVAATWRGSNRCCTGGAEAPARVPLVCIVEVICLQQQIVAVSIETIHSRCA